MTCEEALDVIVNAGRLSRICRLVHESSHVYVHGLIFTFERMTWGVRLTGKGLQLILGAYPSSEWEPLIEATHCHPSLKGSRLTRVGAMFDKSDYLQMIQLEFADATFVPITLLELERSGWSLDVSECAPHKGFVMPLYVNATFSR